MKIMISQPMKGKTNETIRNEREELVNKLESQGHEVIDTIFADTPEEANNKPLWYMSKSIEAMSKVDGVVFMEGWQYARGCKIEYEIAKRYGLFIKEINKN